MRGNPVVRLVQLVLGVAVALGLLIASAGAAFAAPKATGSPTTGLKDGTSVSLSGSGWASGATLFVVECADRSGSSGCATSKLGTTQTTASGSFTTSFKVFTGTVGDGTCDANAKTCFIAVSDGTAANYVAIPISFAGAAAPTSSAPTSSAPTSSAPTGSAPTSSAPTGSAPTGTGGGGSAADPVSVAAGNGGSADHHGPDGGVLILVAALGMLLLGGTAVAVRRR